MDVKSKVMDISSFLLFEATGDSETGCFEPAMSAVVDDDDAESCSCDTNSNSITESEFLPGVTVRELNGLEHKASVGDDEGEVVELHKNRRDDHRRIDGGVRNEKKSSSVSVDSAKPLKEKSRLFWEACLAS